MYGRHRSSSSSSAGNGYRSNGVGVAIGMGRISPDAAAASSFSTRNYGRAPYPSDFNRNFNRTFGRDGPKFTSQHNPPLPSLPSKRLDLLIEAGRLSLDYLVFHGLLSSDLLLPTKTPTHNPNDSSSLPEEIPEFSFDAAGSHRRQSPGGYDSITPLRDSSSPVSFRTHNFDENKHNTIDGPSSNKTNGCSSQDTEPDTDHGSALQHTEDAKGEFNMSVTKMAELVSDVDGPIGLRVEETKKDQPSGDVSAIGLCSVTNFPFEAGDVIAQDSDQLDAEFVHNSSESQTCDDLGEALGDLHSPEAANTKGTNHIDLLKLCNPCNVPTKTRSSLMNKELSPDLYLTGSNAYGRAYRSNLGSHNNDVVPAKVVSDVERLASPPTSEPEICIDTQSSLVEIAIHEQGLQKPASQSASLSSILGNNGGKRAFEDDTSMEGRKKAKGWSSVMEKDGMNSVERQTGSMEWKDSSHGNSLLKKCSAIPSAECAEEKQLFTSSFKICDLNLLESSDINEVHGDSALMYSSISASQKEVTVETDLSISNNSSLHNGYPKFGRAVKDIELIDLGDDSLPEGDGSKNSTTQMQAELNGSESFQNHAQILRESTHNQDGYGLMISELIGTDIQECSSVQLHSNISPSHNDLSLHHEEGLLNEDDQIFMALGEIPLSMPDI